MGQILFPWVSALCNCVCSVFSQSAVFQWCQCSCADFSHNYNHVLSLTLHSTSKSPSLSTVSRWWHSDRRWGRVPEARGPEGAGWRLLAQQPVPGRHELPAIQLGGGPLRQVFTESAPFVTIVIKRSRHHRWHFTGILYSQQLVYDLTASLATLCPL